VTRIGELVTANVVTSSPILVTLMVEALSSPKMSVFTRATRRNIPEDAILHSHRRENLKSYINQDRIASFNLCRPISSDKNINSKNITQEYALSSRFNAIIKPHEE
jgi:hypothetical protein